MYFFTCKADRLRIFLQYIFCSSSCRNRLKSVNFVINESKISKPLLTNSAKEGEGIVRFLGTAY